MFFFIGGVQPKTVVLDSTPRLCRECGLAQARLKRVDHYLSLFFIPIIPVKRGVPVIVCDRCGSVSSPEGEGEKTVPLVPDPSVCSQCGGSVDPSFQFCPHCGRRLP